MVSEPDRIMLLFLLQTRRNQCLILTLDDAVIFGRCPLLDRRLHLHTEAGLGTTSGALPFNYDLRGLLLLVDLFECLYLTITCHSNLQLLLLNLLADNNTFAQLSTLR